MIKVFRHRAPSKFRAEWRKQEDGFTPLTQAVQKSPLFFTLYVREISGAGNEIGISQNLRNKQMDISALRMVSSFFFLEKRDSNSSQKSHLNEFSTE